MRRPSIPFEAIGLHSRLRGAVVSATPAPQEATMSNPDPRDPTQVPDTLKDDVGKTPESIMDEMSDDADEDDEVSVIADEDDEEDDENDSTGFDD